MIVDRRIAVVVHGPEAVDSGLALEIIGKALLLGTVRARVGGASAVAAVIDARLEDTISIDSQELPSVTIRDMGRDADLVLLVNEGKDRDSSLAFGRMVMSKVLPFHGPVVQVENDLNIIWSGDDDALGPYLELWKGEVLDLRGCAMGTDPRPRRLSGVRPGENVWINGNVIGRATDREVFISQDENGNLVAQGVTLKPTGVERLGRFDLGSAIIRSGQVRRTSSRPRSLTSKGVSIYLIDHCAEESVFRCRDASFVVTVGDDTSRIASALLYRFGVPVIAITDGDEDEISNEQLYYPGSYLFRLEPGNDDLVGMTVRDDLFKGEQRMVGCLSIEDMAARVRALCGSRLLWERRF